MAHFSRRVHPLWKTASFLPLFFSTPWLELTTPMPLFRRDWCTSPVWVSWCIGKKQKQLRNCGPDRADQGGARRRAQKVPGCKRSLCLSPPGPSTRRCSYETEYPESEGCTQSAGKRSDEKVEALALFAQRKTLPFSYWNLPKCYLSVFLSSTPNKQINTLYTHHLPLTSSSITALGILCFSLLSSVFSFIIIVKVSRKSAFFVSYYIPAT